MKKFLACGLSLVLAAASLAQTRQQPPTPQRAAEPDEEIVRITTELVQVDAVVMDRNEQPITDLRLEDFEVFDNGRKQELQFMEFVSIGAPPRRQGALRGAEAAAAAATSDANAGRGLTARDVKRVVAFVVDDVTVPPADMLTVRKMLTDFVDNRMGEGDLVAIVRTVGGHGLLEQFTADKQILRRAIAQLGVRSIPPFLAFGGPDPGRVTSVPSPAGSGAEGTSRDLTAAATVESSVDFEGPSEGTNQVPRGVLALSVANEVVNSLREIPGRKSLVLLSGGLPLFDLTRTGAIITDLSRTFNLLTDNALRSGVVINTMDVRGLQTAGAVARFDVTPGKSALGGGTIAGSDENTAGRVDYALLGEQSLTERLTLSGLAATTGGVAVNNSNNFSGGLDRVLHRSSAYYRLAYRPSEKFDNKFHKIDIKVRRPGAKVYRAEGYFARADAPDRPRTKEEEVLEAARSPLARRGIEVAANLQYRFTPANQAALDIQTLINARQLNFEQTPDGKYRTTLDVAGFVFDQLGRPRGGISQTINADLTEEQRQRALAHGIGYTASTQLPPGYYQVRLVVREAGSGNIGTFSRYFEVPDLSNKQLTAGSIILYEIDPQDAKAQPLALGESRTISRKKELRYGIAVHNAKVEGGKHQLRSQMIISQAGKVLFQEPEQPVTMQGAQVIKVGQLGLARVQPGRYTLTLVVTDPLADKKRPSVTRSIDFVVIN